MMDPSRTSALYDQMAEKWALPRTLMGGTAAMQAAGCLYLPQHPAENPAVYRERAKRTVLRNYFRRTVQKLVGRVFTDPIAPSPDMPQHLLGYLKNVDLMGQGLNNFAKNWFQDALVSGVSYLLVDYPVKDDLNAFSGTGQNDRRPYAIHIPADRLIAAQWEMIGARHQLTQIRIREKAKGYSGFEETENQQIRVITPDYWEIYRQDQKGHWQVAEAGENSLGEIPLVPLYTQQTGFLEATPPLEDLAYLNLEHYQIRSDQRNALNVASFPILAASGYDPEIDGPLEVGPNKVLTTSDTDGKYYYVESTGAALEAGSRELNELERGIQLFGLQFEAGRMGETATGRSLDAADAITPLGAMVMNLEDSLNLMLKFFGLWSGIDEVGTLQVQANLNPTITQNSEITDLLSLHDRGLIDQDRLLGELQNRGVLKDSLQFNGTAP